MIVALICTVGLLTLTLCELLGRAALHRGWVGAPSVWVARHTEPTPALGGVAIAVSLAVIMAVVACLPLGQQPAYAILPSAVGAVVPVGCLLFFFVGLADDLCEFSPAAKLAAQLFCSITLAFAFGSSELGASGLLDHILLVGWFVFAVNAINVLDVADGLAGLTCLGVCVAIAVSPVAWGPELWVASALVGFLACNAPPARIFLGDAGAHLLGFAMAICSLHAASAVLAGVAGPALAVSGASVPFQPALSGFSPLLLSLPVAAVILVVPAVEVALLVVSRHVRGIRPWEKSGDHLALRLQRAGVPPAHIAGAAGLASFFAASAVIRSPMYAGAVVAIVAALTIRYLLRVP